MPPNPWSEEKTAALKQLVREGYSSGVIAGRLNVTRSAVVGRCHRLGLHLGANRRGLNKFTQFSLRKSHNRPLKKRKPITAKPQPQFEKTPIPPPNINDIGRVKFSELEPHHCLFGVGDPKDADFMFCGLDRIPGRPYCSGHTARCFTPAPVKKRETIRVKIDA